MIFTKALLTNISLLITLAYLFNMGYKYMIQHTSNRMKYILTIGVFIAGGILTMLFGLRINDNIVDLRLVPIIVAVLVFPSPWAVFVIGIGIGLARLGMNCDALGLAGFLLTSIVGAVGSMLQKWLKSINLRFVWKSVIAVVSINILFTMGAALAVYIIHSTTFYQFWHDIGRYTFPLWLLLSGLFVFIIRDFQKEQLRVDELRTMNLLLRRQTRESREAKREIEEKARELMLASKYKSEFLANMSHELKTPLNSIILLSQLMKDNEDERYEGDELRYAELIHGAGNELLQLINDILDLSKVEAGKMDVFFEEVSLHDLVQNLHQQFHPLAEQKKLDFEIDIGPGVPHMIKTDALRLNQILRNLLVNAFKFTETGSIKLIVRFEGGHSAALEPIASGRQWMRNLNPVSWGIPVKKRIPAQRITFMVADTGIGIDPEKQQLIFEAFRQEDGAINRKYGGTGLGLSISLQLSRLLGGSLSLDSVKGEGSKFMLKLPIMPPKQAND
ncbi:ATP-binding protein [Paenibacillus solisilvae]|uniref:histidine kinase n=1 Tax=Paenibacillus solisilvae TaxID=2486751 RepID=A0ABW0W2A1_9BACL